MTFLHALVRRACHILLLAFLLPADSALAQASTTSRTGRVRGIVVDSLPGAPLAGATVSIPLAGRLTLSDSAGRFVLDTVPAGEWSVAFYHAALDSLGFSDFGARVRVFSGASAVVALATPSFETIRGRFCAGTPDSLSPTVAYGGVHSARRSRIAVAVSWLSDTGAPGPLRSGTVRASSIGDSEQWVACGIPWGAWLHALARDSTHTASAILRVGPRGIVTKDLVLADGFSALAGTVRDADGRPVRGAVVSVVDTDLAAETDASGNFASLRVPAGTVTIDVRAVGYRTWLKAVEGGGDSIEVVLRPLIRRSPDAPRGSDYLRLLQRQARGGLQLILDAELTAADAALATFEPRGTCRWWLDGRPVDREFFLAQPRWSWRAIEIYALGSNAPPEYRTPSCAVILLWTEAADW